MGWMTKVAVTRANNLMIGGRIVEFAGPAWPYKFVHHLDESRDVYAHFIIKPIVRLIYKYKKWRNHAK